jgi:hypothetical protein
VWPTTAWPAGTPSSCANLVARYDFAGARLLLCRASELLAEGARSGLGQDGYPAATRARLNAAEVARAEAGAAALRAVADRIAAGQPLAATAAVRIQVQALIESDGSRPAGLIKDGFLLEPAALGNFGSNFVSNLIDAPASVAATGRIAAGGRQWGSGVLVSLADGTTGVLTARHVAQAVTGAAGWDTLAADAEIDFLAEIGAGGTCRHALTHVIAAGPDVITDSSRRDAWDYALLGLGASLDGSTPPEPAPLDPNPLILRPGHRLAIIGYPAKPALAPGALGPGSIWHKLFGGAWHVKRLSPAVILDVASHPDLAGLDGRILLHDATTTGGSSGGAALGIGGGALAAIHVGGREGAANLALRLADICAHQGWTA